MKREYTRRHQSALLIVLASAALAVTGCAGDRDQRDEAPADQPAAGEPADAPPAITTDDPAADDAGAGPATAEALDPASPAVEEMRVLSRTSVAGGLIIEDLRLGEGEVVMPGDTVETYYVGTLAQGGEFDAVRPPDPPAEYPLDRLIKGWQAGVPGMRVGGLRRLTIPPAMGYGDENKFDRENPDLIAIPANSTLVFIIELVGVK